MSTFPDAERRLTKEISDYVWNIGAVKQNGRKDIHLTYAGLLQNKMLLIHLIQEGVPYSLFDFIRDFTPYSEDNWAQFLDLSPRSLHRYRQDSKVFGTLQSEKIMEIAEVTKVGLEVFGDMATFQLWLETPNYALGSRKPISLLAISYGKELVIAELGRIDNGIFV